MKYAVIAHSGKQYKVAEGDTISLDSVALVKPEEVFEFSEVLLIVDDNKRHVGTPTVKGAKVTGKVVSHEKGEKIRVAKFKAKVRTRKVIGFRAKITKVKIDKIETK